MTKNAASESALGDLHSKVARVMNSALDQMDTQQEVFDGLVANAKEAGDDELLIAALGHKVEVNASLISVITKFLSDNKISCAPEDSEELSNLARTLQEKRKSRRKTVGNVVHILEDEDVA